MSVNKDEVFGKIKAVIVDQLGVSEDEITLEASYTDDLGADSLDTVELVMALEEEFSTEIADEDAEKLTSVGKTVDFIVGHIK
jgi:acyl carrier protein